MDRTIVYSLHWKFKKKGEREGGGGENEFSKAVNSMKDDKECSFGKIQFSISNNTGSIKTKQLELKYREMLIIQRLRIK